MPTFQSLRVAKILEVRDGLQRMQLEDGSKAYALVAVVGAVDVGDLVVVNTTAVELGLGTGGWHVVHSIQTRTEWQTPNSGRVLKARYLSEQLEVEPHVSTRLDLIGARVLLCVLHSHLGAVSVALGSPNLGYLMTDQAALPLSLSDLVAQLKSQKFLNCTATAGQAFGGNSGGFDEEVPQAYEQVSDLSAAGSSNSVGSYMDNGGLTWAVPSFELGGATASLVLGWAANADDAAVNNGAVGTRVDSAGVWGTGLDAGLTIATDLGLTVGIYGAQREQNSPVAAGGDKNQDAFGGVWYAKYSAGPVSVGYSHSYLDSGVTGSAETATSAKAIRTAAGIFEETQMSISFNVNDNVSISYTDSDDEYNAQDNASTAIASVSEETTAIQIAYSMGGMSIKAFQGEVSNPGYDSNAAKRSLTEISLGLAF